MTYRRVRIVLQTKLKSIVIDLHLFFVLCCVRKEDGEEEKKDRRLIGISHTQNFISFFSFSLSLFYPLKNVTLRSTANNKMILLVY
jgi:hypothetical protein